MNIFEKRPLSLILCIMLGGFSLFIDAGVTMQLIGIGAALIFTVILFLIKEPQIKDKPICCIAAIALMISILLGIIYQNINSPSNYYNKDVELGAKVNSADHTSMYGSKLDITVFEINGHAVNYRMICTVNKDSGSGIAAGHSLSICGTVKPFASTTAGFNERSYYLSRGYTARLANIESISITSFEEPRRDYFAEWRKLLSDELKKATNVETGGFLAALILGDTESLDPNTKLNFTSAGISHLLALSGMHLVILSEAIKKILGLFRLNKKFIVTASTLFAIFYMLLTGCPQSVVRATVMLIITNLLFLLANAHDTYTTLPLSVFLILLAEPYAVYDLSLWLSAFATLGILAFTDYRGKEKKKRQTIIRALLWVWDAILATIFSVGACYAIMAINFRTFSVVAPITTLIFSVPVNMLIYVGILVLLFPSSIPIGTPVIWFTDTLKEGVEIFASESWMPISLDFPAVSATVAVFCISFFALLIFKLKNKRAMAAISVFLFVLSIVIGAIQTQAIRRTDENLFESRRYSDNLLVKSSGTVAMIYTGSHSQMSAWDDIAAISASKILLVDMLILTSYTDDTVIYVAEFISSVKTKTLHLPEPRGIYECEQAETIANMLSLYGTGLDFYATAEPVEIGDITYRELMRSYYLPGEISSEIYSLSADGKQYTYLSDGAAEEFGALAHRIYDISDSLFFGGYGVGTSSSYRFTYVGERIKEIYFSGESYLSDSASEYYEKREVPITEIGTS